ncbi:MAG: GTPase [Methylococcaceae bacterium]
MKNYRHNDIQSHISRNGLLVPLDILLVGATGTGKSSTLNALFNSTVAKVGEGVDPETQNISAHKLHDYLRFHDSAGLGDGKENDLNHSKNITSELLITCGENDDNGFIDLVMVLLDGSSRDLGTTFQLLESVVLKSIEPKRVIVAVNQADMAMKGRYWNSPRNKPEPTLIAFLEEQSLSVKQRINDSTGLSINKPVYYSAKHNYNIDGLLNHVIDHFPTNRRILK